MVDQNAYEVLGVKPSATKEEIDAAFRRRAKQTHPDAGGSHEAFVLLMESYRIIGDPERRARYDRGMHGTLRDARRGGSPSRDIRDDYDLSDLSRLSVQDIRRLFETVSKMSGMRIPDETAEIIRRTAIIAKKWVR